MWCDFVYVCDAVLCCVYGCYMMCDVWWCVWCVYVMWEMRVRESYFLYYTQYTRAPSIKMLGQKHPCTHNHIIHASYNIVMQWVFLIIKNPWVWPSTPAISFSVHYVSKSYSDYHPCHLFTWYTPLTIYPATLHSKLPLSNSCVTIPHPFLPKFEWAALISCDRGCG